MTEVAATQEARTVVPAGSEDESHWFGRRALSETVLTNGALLGVGALTGIVTARVLGPSGRGHLAVSISIAGVLWPVASLGLQQAFAYTLAQRSEDARQAVGLSIAASFLIGGGATAAAALVVGAVVRDSATRAVIQLGLLSIPFAIANAALVGILQGLRQGRRFNLARLSTPIVYALLLAGMVIGASHGSVKSVIWIYVAACAAGGVAALLLLPPRVRRAARPTPTFWRATLRYGALVNLSSLGYSINRQLPVILIGAFGLARDAGQYSVAMGYALPVSAVAVALALHTLPDIAAEPDDAVRRALARLRIRTCLVWSVPLAVTAVLAAPVLIPFAFGPQYARAVLVARVLVIAQVSLGISFLLSEISRGLGRPGLPVLGEWSGVLATAGVVPVAFKSFGLIGAATASLLIYCGVIAVLLLGNREMFRPRRQKHGANGQRIPT